MSPEQVVHELGAAHGRRVAAETIYQALYSPQRLIQRDARDVLRTGRPYRRPRRRGDQRRPRFMVPITLIEQRPQEADNREVPGHWEGDLVRHEALLNRVVMKGHHRLLVAASM